MIRTVNIACLAMTGLVCLGLYRLAEEARVAQVDLRTTERAIQREREALAILGTEWARLTQPARIGALAKRHLHLIDKPAVRLSSLSELPAKALPLAPEGAIRTVKAIVPAPGAQPQPQPALAVAELLAGR